MCARAFVNNGRAIHLPRFGPRVCAWPPTPVVIVPFRQMPDSCASGPPPPNLSTCLLILSAAPRAVFTIQHYCLYVTAVYAPGSNNGLSVSQTRAGRNQSAFVRILTFD